MPLTTIELPKRKREVIDEAVIRFCGDSGDGMQITGSQFTNTVALYGNDLATFPDYPAEIRAPAGTLPGVSGFQVHFSSSNVYTPGDSVDVLIAMNPAALKMNLPDLRTNGILIVNSDDFKETDLRKAQITVSPLEDHSLDGYRLFAVELTKLTRAALKDVGLTRKAWIAARISSRSACATGFTTAPWSRRCAGSTISSRTSRCGLPPINSPCRRATVSARPPKRFKSATKFLRPSCRRASIAISAAMPRSLSASSPPRSRPASRCSWVPIPSRRLPIFFTSFPCTRISV